MPSNNNQDSIQQYLDSINNSIESLQKNKNEITDDDLPSDFKLMMMGAKDSRVLNFIFDNRIDRIIDQVLNKLMTGDMSEIEKYLESISKIFETLGLGQGAFSGPVSQTLMQNIMNSLNSVNFNQTKNNIKKVMMVLKNLKQQSKFISDPATKKKYIEAVYAFKKVLKFISKIYKNRRIITNRVKQGLHNAVNEELDIQEPLEAI